MANLKKTTISGTGAVILAAGTTAQRTAVTYTTQSFTSSGPANFTVPNGVGVVDVLVVGGGGGGANALGGGGGGGGFIEARNYPVVPGSTIPVIVGAGGAGGNLVPQYIPGNPGSNSSFGSLIAYGGGAGAGYANPPQGRGDPSDVGTYANHGYRGGSGGGGGGSEGQITGAGQGIQGDGTPYPGGAVGWGYPGGSGWGGSPRGHAGGGGGGAGGPGGPNRGNGAGDGGPGRASDISGSVVYYAGGGGGGSYAPTTSIAGAGGIGGGGRGKVGQNPSAFNPGSQLGEPGATNTGGGGGCGGYPRDQGGGSGGPGIVIVRYALESTTSKPLEGAVRFNSNLNRSEIFKGSKWIPLGPKTVQSFTATGPGNFTVPTGITEIEVLVVGGGGSAGNIAGGGGGGGVVYHNAFPVTPGGTIAYSVGAGGTTGPAYPGPPGSNGTPSVFGGLTAYGGGASGSWTSSPPGGEAAVGIGSGAGGPGSGGTGVNGGKAGQWRANAGTGASNFGNPGARGGTNGPQGSDYGLSTGSGQYTGGGGGGAGRSGGFRSYIVDVNNQNTPSEARNDTTTMDAGRQGGDGLAFDISGTYRYYGGGGGGGAHSPGYNVFTYNALGGLGGGGPGAGVDRQAAPAGRGFNGENNTGGGGGGGYYTGGGTSQGGNGGPGIIIVRY
jgi:hypothetical protein